MAVIGRRGVSSGGHRSAGRLSRRSSVGGASLPAVIGGASLPAVIGRRGVSPSRPRVGDRSAVLGSPPRPSLRPPRPWGPGRGGNDGRAAPQYRMT